MNKIECKCAVPPKYDNLFSYVWALGCGILSAWDEIVFSKDMLNRRDHARGVVLQSWNVKRHRDYDMASSLAESLVWDFWAYQCGKRPRFQLHRQEDEPFYWYQPRRHAAKLLMCRYRAITDEHRDHIYNRWIWKEKVQSWVWSMHKSVNEAIRAYQWGESLQLPLMHQVVIDADAIQTR